MLTIPLRIPSTSASEASLKETSHTLMIFCCSSRLMSMNTGTFILNTFFHFSVELRVLLRSVI